MDNRPSLDSLESNHSFPGVYQIKAIGAVADGFEDRVIEAVRAEVGGSAEVAHSGRRTKEGRYVAVTVEIVVQSAEQVRSIYGRIQELKGIHLLF